MNKSAFRYGFDRDLVRTALGDEALGGRTLRARPHLEGAAPAELIAGARALRVAGRLPAKTALRLAGGLLDLGFHDEAIEVLEDDGVDYAGRDAPRRLGLARALAAAGEPAQAAAALASAASASLPQPAEKAAAALARALAPETVTAAEAPALAGELCGLALAALAAEVLAPHLESSDPRLIEAAFEVLRLSDGGAAVRLIAAMQRPYRLEGREAAWRATLAVLEGGPDAGVEPEGEGSSRLRLLLRACLGEACAAAGLWPAAIARFDYAGRKWREPPDSLCELARCVGRDLLEHQTIRLLPQDDQPARAYDVFPYNGEARMLQLKLREMSGWIDRFVLVEADETFPGRPKPLYFQADPQGAAGELAGRIVPVVAPRPPAHIAYTWAREFFQKDSAVLALDGLCRPGDLVILSDADEILDREAVAGFEGDVAPGALRTFRYFLNCELISETPPLKATLARACQAAAHGWNYLRLGAIRYRRGAQLKGAGWHFSSIGNAEWLAYKMQCTAHEEWSYQDQSFFARFLTKMRKEGGLGADFVRREIDEGFPASIRESRDSLTDIIL